MPLAFCTQYKASSCCTPAEDAALQYDFETVYDTVYNKGCPGCLMNMRAMYCALYCSPTQADFLVATTTDAKGHILSGVMRVYDLFCDRFYAACKTKWPATEFPGMPASFCKTTLDTALNITMYLSDSTAGVFHDWTANHCDGSITDAPLKPKSGIGIGWILLFVGAIAASAVIVVSVVYVLSNKEKPPEFQPVPEPEPEKEPEVAFRVAGAGAVEANGNYFADGEKNGAEVYRNHHGVFITRERLAQSDQLGWIIGDGRNMLYGIRSSLLHPPRSGWRVYAPRATPPPTVILITPDSEL